MSSPRLMDQVRDVLRVHHYSLRTEQSYTQWIRGIPQGQTTINTRPSTKYSQYFEFSGFHDMAYISCKIDARSRNTVEPFRQGLVQNQDTTPLASCDFPNSINNFTPIFAQHSIKCKREAPQPYSKLKSFPVAPVIPVVN